jgi:hypothetical protein
MPLKTLSMGCLDRDNRDTPIGVCPVRPGTGGTMRDMSRLSRMSRGHRERLEGDEPPPPRGAAGTTAGWSSASPWWCPDGFLHNLRRYSRFRDLDPFGKGIGAFSGPRPLDTGQNPSEAQNDQT